jgi:hypothetical protein
VVYTIKKHGNLLLSRKKLQQKKVFLIGPRPKIKLKMKRKFGGGESNKKESMAAATKLFSIVSRTHFHTLLLLTKLLGLS